MAKELKSDLVFDESPDAIIITDGSTGKIVHVNNTCVSVLGYSKEEIIGQNFKFLFPRGGYANLILDPEQITMYDDVLPGKKIKKKDGSTILMDLVVNNVIDGEDKYVVSNLRDATERIKMQNEIADYAQQLKELNSSKDKYFSIIAHDLKNPFVSLLGFINILKEDFLEMSDEEKLEIIGELEKVASNSHQLLENLLTWSRSQLGRIDVNPITFYLKPLVEKTVDLVSSNASQKQIEVKSQINDNVRLFGDDEMIQTVLRNLLSNAIKFSPRGNKVIIGGEKKDNKYEIFVKDTGIGMSQETIDNIFKVDKSVSTLGTDDEKGTGLGLVLCEEFVHKNNGTIRIESVEGEGSTFYFTLPFDKDMDWDVKLFHSDKN
ncbi:MAG: PAS domain-containing sensor histidine kinase [Melioribacteraceae bacterium]|nr:PAS domain-containing sensor histidine kinase [Melioribacteraceae bacterium]MCF8264412.1 PAS domain-containing sensor histidine kinase [Melioribacteraceae bacterium]MCF8432096.1 PAS domain-containing sensor histidine kinase [Melioribacteraceae bacterium]